MVKELSGFNPSWSPRSVWNRHRDQVADAMIEAGETAPKSLMRGLHRSSDGSPEEPDLEVG